MAQQLPLIDRLVLYSRAVNSEISGETLGRLAVRLRRWAGGLRAWRLAGVVDAFLDSAGPIGVIGAQVLWTAQPILSRWLPEDEISALAHLIDAPEGIAWLREQLSSEDGA